MFSNLLTKMEKINFQSTLGFKYPPSRDNPLNIDELWLDDKRETDGAEDYWRIYDKLYDFDSFVNQHPGGRDWLILTKGTDITEAFESHHIRELPKNLLDKYYVRDAKTTRNSPFTFDDDGFYMTLKKRIRDNLIKVPEDVVDKSKFYTDTLLISFLTLTLISARFGYIILSIMAGLNLALLGNASHNFFHQKDNFRMFYINFTLMSSKSWRISHALSHHQYPNTILDMEISFVEPFLNYLPEEKNKLFRFISWLITPFVYGLGFIGHFVLETTSMFRYRKTIRYELLLPICLLIVIILIGSSFLTSLITFLIIEISGSFLFTLIGLNAAHHHPYIFHDGDTTRPRNEMDWGIYQIDATRDRKEFIVNQFRVLIAFGDHTLHHLFPTIDHGKLNYFYPILYETCKEFGIDYKITTQLKLIRGQFLQLIRDKPRNLPPKSLRFEKTK